jgi:hypothetical protein
MAATKLVVDEALQVMVATGSEKRVRVYNYQSNDCIATGTAHAETITCSLVAQDKRHILTYVMNTHTHTHTERERESVCVCVW